MKAFIGSALGLALLAAVPAAAQNDCGRIRDDYAQTIEELSRTMQIFARCVGTSNGRTDSGGSKFTADLYRSRGPCNADCGARTQLARHARAASHACWGWQITSASASHARAVAGSRGA